MESNSSIASHKRKFLETFRRWEILFKRKDGGDVQAEKWLIAEYYDSLRHLTPAGMDALTRHLKATSTFFPTIRECLEATRAGAYDYGHPFYADQHLPPKPERPRLTTSHTAPLQIRG